MKRTNLVRRVGALALVCCAGLLGAQAENTAAVNEVLKLKNAGVNEDTIVAFIQGKNINYELSADNILALREKGVSQTVLNAMLASGRAAAVPVPGAPSAPPAPAAPPAPSVVPQPVPVGLPTAVTPPAANPDVAYFYQELSPYGRWIPAEDGQWYWQPTVVIATPGWRPYWDKGHWMWTDHGWYWASDYSWGWAVFHYGRWHLHPHHGWIWLPDRVWGPAWVVWRTGGEYCGWAPLPPGAIYDPVAARFTFHGRHVDVGFEFGLAWNHFSFCYVREMGEPPRSHFRREPELHAIYNRTTVINNYTVNKVTVSGETRVQIFNRGIEPTRVTAVKGRKFETVKIQDLQTPSSARGHEHFDARNKTLEVYRPKFGGHR